MDLVLKQAHACLLAEQVERLLRLPEAAVPAELPVDRPIKGFRYAAGPGLTRQCHCVTHQKGQQAAGLIGCLGDVSPGAGPAS